MPPGLVKLCSLREAVHAKWAIEAGADLFGLIFAPTRRQVTIERAREIEAAALPMAAGTPLAVGVFVDLDVVEINNIARGVDLIFAQLHGDETPAMVQQVSVPVIKAIKPNPNESFDEIAMRIDSFQRIPNAPAAFLIDGFQPGHAGGQGVLADWEAARELAQRFPIILAGGLTPANVAEAIETVRPVGVDVSSGVETSGVKDRRKMIDFVANARSAFLRVNG